MSARLPIHFVLPDLKVALAQAGRAILIAPPGAGKTTAVPPALLGESWCEGEIIVTSPRRVAARAAAERIATMLGEKPGQTVGYQTRMDSKVGKDTRIRIMTEAILVNALVQDPELPGVSAILFDEAHERHLDSDLALALALETREVLREDLRLLVMSATIDGARFSQVLGEGVPIVESEGRTFPLEIRWLGSDASLGVEDRVASAALAAWRECEGDVLAFLPGLREIERTRERLVARLPDVPIHVLHGQVDAAAQRAAIRRDPDGRRRIILATSVAESSLTLDGVRVVIDSGLARMAEFDRAASTTRLVTRRASQAAADQRAGRAARQGPGVAYRLWEEAGHAARTEFAPPEIETADLSGMVLDLARWGSGNPRELRWLDPPPEASLAAASEALRTIDAIDEKGGITQLGSAIAALPMAPHEATALLHGAAAGAAEETARLVMLLQERGLGGRGEDLAQRLERWRGDRSKRGETARRLALGWAQRVRKLEIDFKTNARDAAEALSLARPDFLARRRDASGENWLSAGGRGYFLDPASSLAGAEWLVIGDAQGAARGARITSALALDAEQVERAFAHRLEGRAIARWNDGKKRVECRRERRIGAILVSSGPDRHPDADAIVDILVEKALESLGECFPPGLLARAQFADIQGLSHGHLRDTADLWLRPLLMGRRDLDIAPHRFAEAALGMLEWSQRQKLDSEAPTHFTSPAQTRHPIDYAGEDAPSVEVRAQALFGLDAQPMIGRMPLLLKLTSPAGRPIQSTRDLPGFWRGTWADVVRDMKGRYPKHRWPEQPWLEKPSLKTKNAFNRE